MKKLSLKRILGIIAILFFGFLAIDIMTNCDESVATFNKGYHDMSQIQEERNMEHSK